MNASKDVAKRLRKHIFPDCDCTWCVSLRDAVGEIERLRALLEHAPIAAIRVGEGGTAEVLHLYAPGLPPGDFDLYCEPVSAPETGEGT